MSPGQKQFHASSNIDEFWRYVQDLTCSKCEDTEAYWRTSVKREFPSVMITATKDQPHWPHMYQARSCKHGCKHCHSSTREASFRPHVAETFSAGEFLNSGPNKYLWLNIYACMRCSHHLRVGHMALLPEYAFGTT